MTFTLYFWHWLILGMGLLVLEIFTATFTAIWFGTAAILIGCLLFVFPSIPLPLQVLLWTIASILLTWLWFKYLKPLSIDKTLAGLPREAIIGQIGQVLSIPYEHRRGMMRFPAPIAGADEWQFISQDELAIGDRVCVTDISGNSLIVIKS